MLSYGYSQSERATTYTRSLDVAHLDCIQHYAQEKKWLSNAYGLIYVPFGIAHNGKLREQAGCLIITRSSFFSWVKIIRKLGIMLSISWWQLKLN